MNSPHQMAFGASPEILLKKEAKELSRRKWRQYGHRIEWAENPMSGGLKLALGYGHVVLETLRQRIPP
jgi:hypothetical protein